MKPLRVLVVEDEVMIAQLYAEVLAELGHETCAIATSEQEAVDAALKLAPDLMIVDKHLHQGSGSNAIARIIATRFVPHILVSGDAASSTEALRPSYLQKPFNEEQLLRAITAALEECPAGEG